VFREAANGKTKSREKERRAKGNGKEEREREIEKAGRNKAAYRAKTLFSQVTTSA